MSLNTKLKKIIIELEELGENCNDTRDIDDLDRIIYELIQIHLIEPI